jgi:hypothetical protein
MSKQRGGHRDESRGTFVNQDPEESSSGCCCCGGSKKNDDLDQALLGDEQDGRDDHDHDKQTFRYDQVQTLRPKKNHKQGSKCWQLHGT